MRDKLNYVGCRVLSIGPTFQINAQAKASLDLDLDMTVGVKYTIDKAEFTFPKGGSNGGSFDPGDTRMSPSSHPERHYCTKCNQR
jgi:hypothetical protein